MVENGLKAICELMGQTFTIPHYQRGYRWEDQEVTELLDDLWAFQKDNKSGHFYCLQPIVLQKNKNGNYDVLDGQQRLTTLYLLLVYLEDRRKDENYLQPLFSLNYTTRKNCEEFLSEKKFANGDVDSSNIDFFHICKAYQCIDKWFKDEKHKGAKGKLVPILLDETEKENRNVRVIRYEVEKGTKPIDVFIRLNIGKIPLTDAELTKALLLQSDKYPKEELKFIAMKLYNIATAWDIIENTMQDKAFWYFLNAESNEKSTHIEFIFDLLANKINVDKQYLETKPKKYATFLIFSEYLQDLIDNEIECKEIKRIEAVKKIWDCVIDYFEYFNEWFNDRTLFHYIGFLITVKGNKIIENVIQEAKKNTKSKFKEYLEREIAGIIKNEKSLDKLVFKNESGKADYQDIRKILLLHNIFTTLKSDKEKPRFPFELYKEQEWSLEHIHAQNSEIITKDKKLWLKEHIQSLSNTNNSDFEELLKKMNELMDKPEEITDEEFENVVNNVVEKIDMHSDFGDENVHSIRNLCLLDKVTNSQLSNSVFDVKREKIKMREGSGCYIPICTKNVFLKAYTEFPVTNAYWTKVDREGYFKSIQETYNYFVNKIEG